MIGLSRMGLIKKSNKDSLGSRDKTLHRGCQTIRTRQYTMSDIKEGRRNIRNGNGRKKYLQNDPPTGKRKEVNWERSIQTRKRRMKLMCISQL